MRFRIDKQDLAELDQDKLKKAVVALRSGKYKQFKGSMTDCADRLAACCLMVIAQEVDEMPWHMAVKSNDKELVKTYAYPSRIPFLKDSLSLQLEGIKIEQSEGETRSGTLWMIVDIASVQDFHLTHPQIATLLETGRIEV